MTERKAVIKYGEMRKDVQQEAVQTAVYAIDRYHDDVDIASYIKREFDRKHEPSWHCIIGGKFSSYVSHVSNCGVYFTIDDRGILLFKTA